MELLSYIVYLQYHFWFYFLSCYQASLITNGFILADKEKKRIFPSRTALINLALRLRLQNKHQTIAQGLALQQLAAL